MCIPVIVAVFGLLLVLVGVLVPASPLVSQILVGVGIIVLTLEMFFMAISALIPDKGNNNNSTGIDFGEDSDE